MSQDITETSNHCVSRLLVMAKTVAKWISTNPLYISYLIFFSPYILKLICFLYPLLILLLATAICAFSTSTSNSSRIKSTETQDITSNTLLEAEAYKITFDTSHDSVATLADKSDEYEKTIFEAYKEIEIEALAPEKIKSCSVSTPLHKPTLHEIVTDTATSAENEPPTKPRKPEDAKSSICNETEIIKHMVCSTINDQNEDQIEDKERVKEAVGFEINKAESILPFTTTTKSGSNAPTVTSTATDLHKTSKSYDLSSVGSMRREKEWTRTLACKLFEERHNSRGGEDGMDMLWENYNEEEPIDSSPPRDDRRRSRSLKSDRSVRVYSDEGDDDDDDDDVAGSGKMCCLQALKMSSGKVNLGIKSKNMVKLSKVLRGFGWLHKIDKTRK